MKYETIVVNMGPELGRLSYKVSYEKLDELLYSLYPTFKELDSEAKKEATDHIYRLAYKAAKKRARRQYEQGSFYRKGNISVWRSNKPY